MPLSNRQILQQRYRILRPLGQGGMGAVYLAEHTHLTSRRFAIKENIPDPAADPQVLAQRRQQFLMEAHVLAALDHPHLPKVSDYFTEMGNEYLVMDFVEGQNLEKALADHMQQQGKPLPEKPVLIWAGQVLEALEYLHGQRPHPVIHRDIKPANIILTPQGKAKLVDFGLVKLYDPNQPQTASAIQGMGTADYTPLEQYPGSATHTDARTDVYALGATLYHLLTGTTAPPAPARALKAALPPPRQVNPGISAATEAALVRALEVQPQGRFQSAAEMHRALLAAQPAAPPGAASPVLPPVQGVGQAPGRSYRLVRVSFAAIVVVVLAFLAFRPGGFWNPPVSIPPTDTPTPPPTVSTFTPTPPPTSTPTRSRTPTPSRTSTQTRTPTVTPTPSPAIAPIDGAELVPVPAGAFQMGSQKGLGTVIESPQHSVDLDAYWIDQTEVTNAMFQKFITETGHETTAEKAGCGWTGPPRSRICLEGATWRYPQGPESSIEGLERHPVVQVSWEDAAEYCKWAGRRLPTEAEWEKAARGVDARRYPWGDEAPDGRLLNFADERSGLDPAHADVDDGYRLTAPVDSFPDGASPYNALNMAGNVWEWVADWFGDDYYNRSPPSNPTGPDVGASRVLRGGSWDNVASDVRAAYRIHLFPDNRNDGIGFRCARSE